MRSTKLKAALAAAGICTFPAIAVQAQTSSPTGAADVRLEEIMVTGSRVITSGNEAPTPVTVITPEAVMATKPATLYANFSEMPVLTGSRGVWATRYLSVGGAPPRAGHRHCRPLSVQRRRLGRHSCLTLCPLARRRPLIPARNDP